MTNRSAKRIHKVSSRRGQTGAALIFAVSLLVMGLFIGLPVMAFVANLSAQMVIQSDVYAIAMQTAKVMDDQKYWLEAPRPGVDDDKARATAQAAAAAMCRKMGMEAKQVDISFTSAPDGKRLTNCDLVVDAQNRYPLRVSLVAFDMRKFFPAIITLRASNEHTDLPPFALMHMDAPTRIDERTHSTLGLQQRDVAVIPTYGFMNQMVAGSTTPATPYGKGIANLDPENFMAMNHYHLKKSDLQYVMQTGNDCALSSWHAERIIDGKRVVVH